MNVSFHGAASDRYRPRESGGLRPVAIATDAGIAVTSFRSPADNDPGTVRPDADEQCQPVVHADAQHRNEMSGRLTGLIVMLAAATLLASACRSGGPRSCGSPSRPPDPHDRHLHELAADFVFAAAPAGIRYTSTTHMAARWLQGVDASGWKGANVSATFTTTLQRPVLDAVFDQFVEQAGWKLDRYGNRPPDTRQWIKRLHHGPRATLDLWPDPMTTATNHYALSGNVNVPCH